MTQDAMREMRGAALAWAVMDHILAHPERHDPAVWVKRDPKAPECGTAACFAGWTVLLGGRPVSWRGDQDTESAYVLADDGEELISKAACALLGIEWDWIEWKYGHPLFDIANNEATLLRMVREIFGERPA